MTAGRRADDTSADAIPFESAEQRLLRRESEAADLRAESAMLREQLALRDHALDATSTLFVITQFMVPEPLIVYCNKAAAEQHGFRREELLGKPVSILRQWVGHNANYLSDVEAAMRAGRTYHHEDEVTRRDGTTYWLGAAIRPIYDHAGRLTHSVAVGADITVKREEAQKKQELQHKLVEKMKERERMVIELQLAQKLESVGRLAAGIAHEINTPIQYVGDSVYFLRSACDDFNQLLDHWRHAIDSLPDSPVHSCLRLEIEESMKRHDMEFIRTEIPKAFERTFDGVERVTNIVKAMKEFAHPDAHEQSPSDLNHALQTTLLVASSPWSESRMRSPISGLPPFAISSCPQKFRRNGKLYRAILRWTPSNYRAMHSTLRPRASRWPVGGYPRMMHGLQACCTISVTGCSCRNVRMSSRVRSNLHGRHTCRSSNANGRRRVPRMHK